MLVMAVLAVSRLHAIDAEAVSLTRDSIPGLHGATGIQTAASNAMLSLQRAAYVDAAPELKVRDLDNAAQAIQQLGRSIAQYQTTIFHDDDRERFNSFQSALTGALPAFNAALDQLRAPNAAAPSLTGLTQAWQAVLQRANVLVDENHSQATDSAATIREAVVRSETLITAAIAVVFVVALCVGYWLAKAITVPMARLVAVHDVMRTGDLTARLDLGRTDEFALVQNGFNRMADELAALVSQAQRTALQVTTSVTEIAATSREQQATASETAATTSEIGTTSRAIASTARGLQHTMEEVATVAQQSATLAGAGRTGLAHMEDAMQGVMDAAGSVNAKLAILNEKAVAINQVVATITKVADQTNLLSLNAAIEAEKAGEYGRGFAVVATEIRRLADQTAIATYDIEQTVKEIQSAVSAGVMGMDRFAEEVRRGMHDVRQVGTQLAQIISETEALAPRFQTVSEGIDTQAGSAEQIVQALGQLSEAAQQTAESLRQSSQAIDDLTLVANQLRTGVSRFRIEA
jgi:methyl-accepting chemotaxis protein WspA